jgi:SPX domain protein involved in polyphosphate accumulation
MKFGKYLKENISSPWRLEYIQYDLLKTYLKNRQFDHTWNEENETAFIKLFINEKNKVTQFIHNFTQQLLARIKYSEHLLKRTKSCDQSAELSNTSDFTSDFLNNLDDTLIEILFDIHDFSCFIRLNSLGFKKILKKHKKWTLIDHENYISSTASPYDISSISSLLTQYNRQMYSQVSALRFLCHSNKKTFLNACIEKEGDLVSSIVPERRSKKYWIHPDHISEVTAILCMHSYIDPKRFSTLNKQQQLDLSMTNIYFDNDHMDVHADRCASKANTQAIKCKRYLIKKKTIKTLIS